MSLKELLDLSEKLEDRISAYWNFYTIVVIAVGGWLFSVKPQLERVNAVMLTIVLIVFFVSNFALIRFTTNRLTALESEIKAVAPGSGLKSKEYVNQLGSLSIPYRMEISWALHLVIDFAVLIVIFWRK